MKVDEPSAEAVNWNHAMYALEKLSESVFILATGSGDARSRVMEASRYFFRVTPEWLPSEGDMRPRFNAAVALLTRYDPPDWNDSLSPNQRYTNFTYTMTRIRNATAAKAAADLFSVWVELSSLYHEHQRELSSRDGECDGTVTFIDI